MHRQGSPQTATGACTLRPRPSVRASSVASRMADVVSELLATEAALDKLGARSISADEAAQVARNHHVTVRNPRPGGASEKRRVMIGTTSGGRVLTLVIERTLEPTTWLIITGWSSTDAERTLLSR